MSDQQPAHEMPSTMLSTVLHYLRVVTADEPSERLGLRIQIAPSWVRAVREGRISKPDINRIEYIFVTFCGGKVEAPKAD